MSAAPFFFSSRRRHTRCSRDWSSDVCSSDLPANRRVLYNRASCDVDGKPWDPTRKQVWWNADLQKWVGNDVPDFKADSNPKDHMGPFIMNPEGVEIGRAHV